MLRLLGNGRCVTAQSCAKVHKRSRFIKTKPSDLAAAVFVKHFLEYFRNSAVHPERGSFDANAAHIYICLSECMLICCVHVSHDLRYFRNVEAYEVMRHQESNFDGWILLEITDICCITFNAELQHDTNN